LLLRSTRRIPKELCPSNHIPLENPSGEPVICVERGLLNRLQGGIKIINNFSRMSYAPFRFSLCVRVPGPFPVEVLG